MDAEAILNQIGDKEGWNDATKVGILLEYIENQKSNDVFKGFLEEHVAYDEGYKPLDEAYDEGYKPLES